MVSTTHFPIFPESARGSHFQTCSREFEALRASFFQSISTLKKRTSNVITFLVQLTRRRANSSDRSQTFAARHCTKQRSSAISIRCTRKSCAISALSTVSVIDQLTDHSTANGVRL